MPRKAVFLDVDGTLLTPAGQVPATAQEAIKRARQAGHLIFLCTGRSLSELWATVLDIGFDGMVTGDGTAVEVGDAILDEHFMPTPLVQRVTDYFARHQTHVYYQTRAGAFGTPSAQARLLQLMAEAVSGPAELDELLRTSFSYVEAMRTDAAHPPDQVTKILYLDSDLDLDQVRSEFQGELDALPPSTHLFGDRSGELLIPGINKGSGVDLIVAHLGIDVANTIAIGDNYNDITILRTAGTGIAVANAPNAVQEAADELTSSAEQDGILEAFRRHHLC